MLRPYPGAWIYDMAWARAIWRSAGLGRRFLKGPSKMGLVNIWDTWTLLQFRSKDRLDKPLTTVFTKRHERGTEQSPGEVDARCLGGALLPYGTN